MNEITSTGTTLLHTPKEYRKTGNCPHCGAPIYADASITKGKNGEVLTVLPLPYYTCGCRITQQAIPLAPIVTPWYPAPPQIPGTSDPIPWPGTTWIVSRPSDTQCKSPVDNRIPKGPGIDWSRFTGTGGISSKPDPDIICIL